MYIPNSFNITDQQEIVNFIAENGFGQLVSTVAGRLFSTHLPVMLTEDRKTLHGHLARNNPQADAIDNQDVLVTLQGPHGYISPAWYSSTGVPTWNYQAVHLYGRCRVIDDENWLKQVVDVLAEKYEARSATPWLPEYSSGLLQAIVGVEISITDFECKYKLSQNRSVDDRKGVVDALKKQGSTALADAMVRNTLHNSV